MVTSFLTLIQRCSEVDKFLLTYVILKLKLIKGKCILFVNDVERCYRLKLFLEQFSIKSCVLNSELPLNSRYVLCHSDIWFRQTNPFSIRMHIVQEFNKGIYDYIIATDESNETMGTDSDDEPEEEQEAKEDGGADDECMSLVLSLLIKAPIVSPFSNIYTKSVGGDTICG